MNMYYNAIFTVCYICVPYNSSNNINFDLLTILNAVSDSGSCHDLDYLC